VVDVGDQGNVSTGGHKCGDNAAGAGERT
jgi:hypothetical protein